MNIKAAQQNTYDAIVIGSGISGGWAAKELCEKGLKTLVLERGRAVEHGDYPTATKAPWEMPHHGKISEAVLEENPVIAKCYAFDEFTEHFFVKDKEHPYKQEKPFDWIRGYQVGGKSLLWARQTQRWSEYDFEGPKRDGYAVDWPIRYNDLAPWYSYVEKFAGISGNKDGLDSLPDGEFLPPMDLNCVELALQESIAKSYEDRKMIIGRCAHLTEPQDIHREQGRAPCQYRHLCYRGCPYGAYFSSNSSTIPWAAKTGNLTVQPDSVVESIIYDDEQEKVTGVRVINANTKEATEYYADIVFVNAATLNTNLLLLNSTSKRFPNGLGNDSGTLGKYVAFHNYRARVTALADGYDDTKEKVTGVRVIDTNTKEATEYYADVIFVNAATLNTNALLLNSTSNRFPNGLGNDSGVLGKYVAVHNHRGRVTATAEGFDDKYYYGRRPNAGYMPRFRNLRQQDTDADFKRGYAMYINASRDQFDVTKAQHGFGAEWKEGLRDVGPWRIFVMAMGETIPQEDNMVTLSTTEKDEWGMPLLVTNINYTENDEKMIADFHKQASEMLEKAGFRDIKQIDTKQAPGLDIHEMGGCRMGRDPKTSMLNGYNQMHACPNVFVTDGSCMTSVSTQNPSLTFMAMTARAVDYVVKEREKGNV